MVAAADEQPQADELLARPGRGDVGGLDEGGDQGGVDAAAQHCGGLDHRAARVVEPPDTGQHGVGERLGDAGVALAERAEVLDDAERVPGGAGHHLRTVRGQAGGGREGVDRGAGQGPQPDQRGAVGEPLGRRGVLGADRGDDQHAGLAQPAGEVSEQVDGGRTAVLQVVDGQQHRPVERQPPQHGDHGVVRLTALEVDVRRQRRPGRDDRGELGHQGHPRRDVVADEGGQGGRGRVEQGRPQGVDERLEEERALRRVAATAKDPASGGRGQLGHRLEEPGLADARLSLDEQQPGASTAPSPAHARSALASSGSRPTSRDRSTAAVAGASAGSAASRSTETCRSAVSRSGGAELVAEPPGQVVVRRQRRARPPAGDEGAHQRAHREPSNGSVATSSAATCAASAGSTGARESASWCRACRRRASASRRTRSTQSASPSSTRAGWLPSRPSAERAAAVASTGSPPPPGLRLPR